MIHHDEVIKEYFVKLAVWLVVVVGISVAIHFFVPLLCLLGFACLYFSLGERWREHLPELMLPQEPEKQYTFAFPFVGDLTSSIFIQLKFFPVTMTQVSFNKIDLTIVSVALIEPESSSTVTACPNLFYYQKISP